MFNRACPKGLQNPHGKELNISFIGHTPFITYKPAGGSDFLLVQLLAEKFRFIPKFVQEKAKDMVKSNGTNYGMVYSVSGILKDYFYILKILYLGFIQAK